MHCEGEREFAAIAIAGGPEWEQSPLAHTAFPCGICRQVMAEFCDPETFQIILAKSEKEYKMYLLKELLPLSFVGDLL